MRTDRIFVLAFLTAALIALIPAGASAQTPVACTGVPLTDGANLRTAYNGLTGTATSPQAVSLAPCLYDLGTTTLTLSTFVDLVGVTRNDTIITSQVDRGTNPNQGTLTIPSGADVEVNSVTIRNTATECYAVRNASSEAVIADSILEAQCDEDAVALHTVGRIRGIDLVLRADVDGEEVISARPVALEDIAGDSVITDTLMISGGVACTGGFGAILDNGDAIFNNVSIDAECGQEVIGIEIKGGADPLIRNSTVVADSTNSFARGIDVLSGTANLPVVIDTEVSATASSTATGVRINVANSSIRLRNVNAEGVNATTRVGLEVAAGLATVDRSSLEGVANSVTVAVGAIANIAVSKLNGPRTVSGTVTCVGNYDGGYVAITSLTC